MKSPRKYCDRCVIDLQTVIHRICPIACIPSGHLIIKVKGWATMVISSRTVGDIIVIDLDGNYSRDSRPSPDLGEQVKAALATGVKKFLIRLENVEFDGDWGIGQMLACYISIRNVNGILKLSGGSPSTLSFLRITMLDKVLDIYPSVEAALESFATS